MLHRPQSSPRKQRIINNSIVNIDDVSIKPGAGNINWRKISIQKLIKRELILLHKRQVALDHLILETVQEFAEDNDHIFNFNDCADIYAKDIRRKILSPRSDTMYLCAQSMNRILSKWKGYKPKCEVDESNTTFRNYFQHCRSWFDIRKMNMMTVNFWIPTMEILREFSMKAAAKFTKEAALQRSFKDYLNVLLLKAMFEGTIKPSNARRMWLVPAMTFPTFLRRYKHHLNVEVVSESSSTKAIRGEYVNCINIRHNELCEVFYSALKQ